MTRALASLTLMSWIVLLPALAEAGKKHAEERFVYRLKHAPATDVAKAIGALLSGDGSAREKQAPDAAGKPLRGVQVAPEPISNSLIVSGPRDRIDEVKALIEQLDQPPRMVTIQIVIAEMKRAKADEAKSKDLRKRELEIVSRHELTAINGQKASIQVGQRVPRVTGVQKTQSGRIQNVTFENVGMLVAVDPRISADGLVVMEVSVERSQLGPQEDGALISASSDGEVLRTPATETLTVHTTLCARDGQSVLLGGLSTRTDPGQRELMLVVTPRILDTAPAAKKGK